MLRLNFEQGESLHCWSDGRQVLLDILADGPSSFLTERRDPSSPTGQLLELL